MKIYTIGFTKKNAEQFFELLKHNGVQLLVDVRINNHSQLAGFTKSGDIQYLLKAIAGIDYVHEPGLAPTKELLKSYQAGDTSWQEYELVFDGLMEERKLCEQFVERFQEYEKVCLLCSEATPEQCHRRLVAEKIKEKSNKPVEIIHL